MTDADHDLWRRIDAFRLDDARASLTFTSRLARENDWGLAFACRVVEEYKRFVFLAMTAGHEVTPSDEVDQAWHLHLTYTRSYWDDFCGRVLGRPLHHGPTKGGPDEGARFEEQYARTLESYREAFGDTPPRDIWPPAAVRFGEAPSFVRVNRRRVWVLPKPWRVVDRRPLAFAGAWIALTPPLAAGTTLNPFDFDGPTFLTFYAVVAAIAVVGSLVCRHVFRVDAPESGDVAEEPAEVGALRAGWRGAFHAEMASLLTTGALQHEHRRGWLGSKHRFVAQREPSASDSEIQRALLERAARGGDAGVEFSALGSAAEPLARRVEEQLTQRGLLESPESFRPVSTAVGALMGSVLLLGVIKLAVGAARDKPIGYLLFGVVALVVLTFFLMTARPRLSKAGSAAFKRFKSQRVPLMERASKADTSLVGADAAMAVAMLGVAACPSPQFEGMRRAVQTTTADSGGCGSGDGGCGGGGCGGCGGCGG